VLDAYAFEDDALGATRGHLSPERSAWRSRDARRRVKREYVRRRVTSTSRSAPSFNASNRRISGNATPGASSSFSCCRWNVRYASTP
jgi:hypothetical protein